jgi:HAE1 family hydrophobic/amphiphilic exporter-1
MQAAIVATKEITLAVMATTLSLVIIFVPIAFMTGYARRYVNQFGWTMAFSVMVSLLVSFTLTPMLSSRLLKRIAVKRELLAGNENGDVQAVEHTSKESRFFSWIDRFYGHLLEWSHDHRAFVLLVALGVFALTFPLNALVGRDWIPPDDQSEFNILLNAPEGTSVEGTSKISLQIADKVARVTGVEFVNPYIHEGAANHSHIYVRLTDISKRKMSNMQIADDPHEREPPPRAPETGRLALFQLKDSTKTQRARRLEQSIASSCCPFYLRIPSSSRRRLFVGWLGSLISLKK